MEIMLKLDMNDVNIIKTVLIKIDPTGFFIGPLINTIKEQIEAQTKNVQFVQKAK